MSRFNIVKKCLDAMSPDEQNQIIDSCVTIVTNSSSKAIPVSGKPKARTKAVKTKKANTALVVLGVEYRSFANFCDKNDLKKPTVYAKYRKIKTPKAKAKFLEECLQS